MANAGSQRTPSNGTPEEGLSRALTQLADELHELRLGRRVAVAGAEVSISPKRAEDVARALRGLVGVLDDVYLSQVVKFIPTLNDYIEYPSHRRWESVVSVAAMVLRAAEQAIEVLRQQDSDYIFEDSYRALKYFLAARTSSLQELMSSPQPAPHDLSKFRDRYVQLVRGLNKTIEELSSYARERNKPPIAHAALEVRAATLPLLVVSILGAISGVVFAALGLWLALGGGPKAMSSIKLFGQEITTENVGVACIFIGCVTVVITLRRALNTLDIAILK